MVPARLTSADYQQAAALLRTGVAEIKAVRDVESAGYGFLPDGRILIRFEGHRFRKETGRIYDKSHPTLSHPYMPNCPHNKGPVHDYARLKIAMALNPTAALLSTSWGLFQVMGDEFWRCGFKDVHTFVDDLKKGEKQHLLAASKFIISKKLDDELRDHEWDGFAYGYNGEHYRDNKYQLKLALRFAFHVKNP
ncbi:N-acetylmuramidase family protein [Spirosoma sp. BT702]|uniref:N-acetylmuramidase family protein n=1 Tax=Spirosoma profusum TaxID=2771354 RepID=A0A926XTP2_9BACT|nr:N-acetylmuramidase family protein [Spirosoma profusum]MBD2700148.1 N-acetylmuramidase family protein [Spirosoma profusum]